MIFHGNERSGMEVQGNEGSDYEDSSYEGLG